MSELDEHPQVFPSHDSSGPVQAARALAAYLRRLRDEGHTHAAFDEAAAAAMLLGTLFADAMARDAMPAMFPSDPDAAVREYVRLFASAIGVASPLAKGSA